MTLVVRGSSERHDWYRSIPGVPFAPLRNGAAGYKGQLHRRIARGFRKPNNYRLRMLLIGGGATPMTPHSAAKSRFASPRLTRAGRVGDP
jgi:hypothetical protein